VNDLLREFQQSLVVQTFSDVAGKKNGAEEESKKDQAAAPEIHQ